MLYSLAALALAGVAAAIPATSATSAPPASPSCMTSYSGTFEIQVINVTTITTKRDLEKDGVLTDALGRIGYIAANSQFQFDYAAQPGSPYNAGWAVCSNSSLTLGPYATFQECLSGDFYNLYLNNPAGQCSDVYIDVIGGNTGAVSQQSDGQPTASSALPVTQISDGQPQLSTAIPVTQISDGQIQISTAVPVSQISDGQPQVPTSMAAPISQLSDGQPQAPLSTAAPVTQLSDGQPQAPLSTVTPVSQISDGQPQVPTNGTVIASPTATVVPFTGAAAMPTVARGELFGLAAGVLAIAML